MNPLPECCIPHSAPIPHQFVMKVYVDAWIYVTEKFVNMGNIELYEGVLRYEKADYPPIPNFIFQNSPLLSLFYVVRFWGRPLIFDGKSTLLPMDGSPNQTNQSPVRSSVSNSRAYSRRLWGSFAWLRAATCSIFSPFPIFGIASCGI